MTRSGMMSERYPIPRPFDDTVRKRFLRDESFRGASRATRRDLTPMVARYLSVSEFRSDGRVSGSGGYGDSYSGSVRPSFFPSPLAGEGRCGKE